MRRAPPDVATAVGGFFVEINIEVLLRDEKGSILWEFTYQRKCTTTEKRAMPFCTLLLQDTHTRDVFL